jgi:hypothetical protein
MVLPEVPVLAQQYARTNSLQDLVYDPLVGWKINFAMNDLSGLTGCDSVTHRFNKAQEMRHVWSEAREVQVEIKG